MGYKGNSKAFKSFVNETKTKSMGFGMAGQRAVYNNGNVFRQVEEHKYLGTIIRGNILLYGNQDVFYKNYSFICDKSRTAIFGLQKKLKFPPSIYCHANVLFPPIINETSWEHV